MNSLELVKKVGNAISNKKGIDISIIDISQLSSFADYFVNATATNQRMLEAIQEEVEKVLLEDGLELKRTEGKGGSGWVLCDYGDIIVNIFMEEQREKYQLDKIWGDGDFIDFED